MTTRTRASFTGPITPSMKRAGLKGNLAKVTLDGDALRLADESNELVIAARDVERIRTSAFRGSKLGPSFEAQLLVRGLDEPILLMPQRRTGGYAALIRKFAAQVAAEGGLERVWRGPGIRTALVNMILVMGSLGALLALLVYAAIDSDTWPWSLAAALLALAYLALLRNQLVWHWPRRVRSLDELDFQLPTEGESDR